MNWLQDDQEEGHRQGRSRKHPPEDELWHPGHSAQCRGLRAHVRGHSALQTPQGASSVCRWALSAVCSLAWFLACSPQQAPTYSSKSRWPLPSARKCPPSSFAHNVLTPRAEGTHRGLCTFPWWALRWATAGQSQLPPRGQGPAHHPLSTMLKSSSPGAQLLFPQGPRDREL